MRDDACYECQRLTAGDCGAHGPTLVSGDWHRQYLISERLDAYVSEMDAARERLGLTNGEVVVCLAFLLAGLMDETDRHVLREAIGFILHYARDQSSPKTRRALRELATVCHVDVDARWRQ